MVALPAKSKSDCMQQEKQSCCISNFEKDNPSKKDCSDNTCNPFLNCCSMMGFIPSEKPYLSLASVEIISIIPDSYLAPQSNFVGSIWHPPQV